MAATEGWQGSTQTAVFNEPFLGSAKFRSWPQRLLDAADVSLGDHVLDVGSGTVSLAREATRRVGPTGRVVGCAANPSVVSTARRLEPEIGWQRGDAAALPFGAAMFTAVVSQFGLDFRPDQGDALREMWRVLSPGGRLAVAVTGCLSEAPAHEALAEWIAARVSADAVATRASAIRRNQADRVAQQALHAGINRGSVGTVIGEARFASAEEFMRLEIGRLPLAASLDHKAIQELASACGQTLAAYVQDDGALVVSLSATLLTATKI